MEKSKNRVALEAMLETQRGRGTKRGEICRVLLHKGFTESEIGSVLGIDAKTVHASKIDFSAAGKAKAEKVGHRIHLDLSKARLKEIDGKKQTAKLVDLVEKVLKEERPKEKTNA